MKAFNVWGQIQEISPTRFLVIATACPITSGRQLCLSEVVPSANQARQRLTGLMQKLEERVAADGGQVTQVNRLPRNSLRASGLGTPGSTNRRAARGS